MTDSEFDRRKELSFLQAEGLEELPQVLKGPVVTARFRVVSLTIFQNSFGYQAKIRNSKSVPTKKSKLIWIEYFHNYEDEIPYTAKEFNTYLKNYIKVDVQLLDLLQYCAKRQLFTHEMYRLVESLLSEELIGYRFMGNLTDGNATLVPIFDEASAAANQENYKGLTAFKEAQEHFIKAGEDISNSHFRGSVSESIHGVESVLKSVTGESTAALGKALNILAKQKPLNPVLKQGLDKLYGWTNGPDGIRHAMTDQSSPVTESEAMFMLSACLAFAAWIKREAQTPEVN